MISLTLLVLGAVLVVLPGVAPLPLCVRPSDWSRAAVVSLVTGLVAIEFALVLWAAPMVFRLVESTGIADICQHAMESSAPVGTPLAWAAVVLAAVLPWRAARAARRSWLTSLRARVEPWLGHHEDCGDYELVVLPTAELLAMSVPANRPQVLLSDGLLTWLDATHVDAVIRHEASHQRHRHWRYSLVAAATAGALRPFPLVLRSGDRLAFAMELWADEDAGGEVPSRRRAVTEAIQRMREADCAPGATGDPAASGRLRRLESRVHPTAFPARVAVFLPLVAGMSVAVMLAAVWAIAFHHGQGLSLYC